MSNPFRWPYVLRLWFGVTEPVGRRAYALSGLALATCKYAGEALVIWLFTNSFFAPWHFLNPVLSLRTQMLQPAPEWLAWGLFVWTLPFLWIAISMSVRRAADAGLTPWCGLIVLAPLINLVFMIVLCLAPGKPGDPWSPFQRPVHGDHQARDAALAIGASLLVAGLMMVVSIYLFSSYGAALFVGTPVVMGAVAAFLYNRRHSRSYLGSAGIGLVAIVFAAMALLLFALEGLICIAMAVPLLLPLGALGGVMGKAIADSTRRPAREVLAAVLLLPMFAATETWCFHAEEREVLSAVEINAPPDVVWDHIIGFPDLPSPHEWYFRLGIACPQRARIVGEGVGAVRYCEFTTGTFVEPITAWEPGRRLAFDVTDQPAPMFELTPYRHIHPPHLDGYLRSKRGEFLLIELPGGRTRLEGRTWYQFEMFPQVYWTLWSDLLIHRIHQRVLLHIQSRAEPLPVARG
jgi:hypothetical protein